MTQVGMHEAKTKLSQLVARAERGEEIVIARNGQPKVRLVPVEKTSGLASIEGKYEGQIRMSDDFDDMPPGWEEVFSPT